MTDPPPEPPTSDHEHADLPEPTAAEMGSEEFVSPALDAMLRSSDVWVEPPPGLEDQVVGLLASNVGSVGVGGDADQSTRVRWVLGLAAAALIAVVVTAGVVTLGNPERGGGVAVALSGTELARSASARAMVAVTPGGTKIVLDVDDLEPAPAGRYYQAWISTDDTTVSAGSFHFRGGKGTVELWCGIDDPAGATLVITLQEAGAPDGPSDRVVLAGIIGG